MKKIIKTVWGFMQRITGFSVPVIGGGLQWKEDSRQTRIKSVVTEHIQLYNTQFPLDPPCILRAGAATLHDNSELLDICTQLELRGYRHQFIVWQKHGIETHEFLEFAKWQVATPRAAKTILTDKERDEVVTFFRKSKENK